MCVCVFVWQNNPIMQLHEREEEDPTMGYHNKISLPNVVWWTNCVIHESTHLLPPHLLLVIHLNSYFYLQFLSFHFNALFIWECIVIISPHILKIEWLHNAIGSQRLLHLLLLLHFSFIFEHIWSQSLSRVVSIVFFVCASRLCSRLDEGCPNLLRPRW